MRCLPLGLLFVVFAAAGSDGVREPEGFWSGPMNSAVPATITGGQVIHEKEFERLLRSAGFRLSRIVPTNGPLSIVESVKI